MKLRVNILALIVWIALLILACLKSNAQTTTATDIDGNTYSVQLIGTQYWMTQNLRVTKYNNGNLIFNVVDSTQADKGQGAYTDYRLVATPYGHLYNFNVILDTRNVCPAGYKVPSLLDWKLLVQFMYSNYFFNNVGQLANFKTFNKDNRIIGAELKAKGTTLWTKPNTAANDTVGFRALPGGVYGAGRFLGAGLMTAMWTSTPSKPGNAYYSMLSYNSPFIQFSEYPNTYMASIRCMTYGIPVTPIPTPVIIYITADQTTITADNINITADQTHI